MGKTVATAGKVREWGDWGDFQPLEYPAGTVFGPGNDPNMDPIARGRKFRGCDLYPHVSTSRQIIVQANEKGGTGIVLDVEFVQFKGAWDKNIAARVGAVDLMTGETSD